VSTGVALTKTQLKKTKTITKPNLIECRTELINTSPDRLEAIAVSVLPVIDIFSYRLPVTGHRCGLYQKSRNVREAVGDPRPPREDSPTMPRAAAVKAVLTGILPLQMDGGKDINLRKLIPACVVIGGNALLYDLHDTERGVLNAHFYIDLVKKH
jgi:hypothetical protein